MSEATRNRGYTAALLMLALVGCAASPPCATAGGNAPSNAMSPVTRAVSPDNVFGATLAYVRAAGKLRCGVVSTPEDWNKSDLHGPLAALDIEVCKAVGVAVSVPALNVVIHGYNSELDAQEGLSTGDVELIVGVTPDATSMWHEHIVFGPPIFYDGLGILVRADSKAASIKDLKGLKVCVIDGTDNEKVLYARTLGRGIDIIPMPFQEEGEMDDAFVVRHCDALGADLSRLALLQTTYAKRLAQDRILPDVLTLSPVAPAYRRGDAQWAMIVDWTIHALVQAEASGLTQANVRSQGDSQDPEVQHLTGVDWSTSRALGLPSKDWAAQVIAAVGNYGEIYERTVGAESPLRMSRGLNALWTNGGLMHPLPVQ